MGRVYIVTGAAGHLGGTLVRLLLQAGAQVRGLILPDELTSPAAKGADMTYICGDVRDKRSLEPLFDGTDGQEVVVFHTAGIVDITGELTEQMEAVNVGGTRHMVAVSYTHLQPVQSIDQGQLLFTDTAGARCLAVSLTVQRRPLLSSHSGYPMRTERGLCKKTRGRSNAGAGGELTPCARKQPVPASGGKLFM